MSTYQYLACEAQTFTAPPSGSVVLTYGGRLSAGPMSCAFVTAEVRIGRHPRGTVLLAASDDHALIAADTDVDGCRQLVVSELHPGAEYTARILSRFFGTGAVFNPELRAEPVADWRDTLALWLDGR